MHAVPVEFAYIAKTVRPTSENDFVSGRKRFSGQHDVRVTCRLHVKLERHRAVRRRDFSGVVPITIPVAHR